MQISFRLAYHYSEYMDSYLFMNLYEMPEDSVINTEAIQDWMHREKLTMEDIRCLQEGAVKDYLGFSFEELRLFGNFMCNHQNNAVYFFISNKQGSSEGSCSN